MEQFTSLFEVMSQYDVIVVLRHIHPDYDALGSQAGLVRYLRHRFPNKKIYIGGHEPSIDPNFIENPVQLTAEQLQGALGIVVDCSTYDRIDGKEMWDACAEHIFIDHHVKGPSLTTHEYVNEDASSCAEIVADFIQTIEMEPTEKEVAEALYCGMIADSIRFSINTTTADTLQIAGYLLQSDLDVNRLNNQVFQTDMSLYRFANQLRNIATYQEDGLVYCIANKEDFESYGVSAQMAKTKVSVFGEIRGIKAWAVMVEEAEDMYSASLRSHNLQINDIAAAFGGGGHVCAAGIPKLTRKQCDEVIEKLQQRVKDYR